MSFIAIAVFGIFAMNHGGGHSRGCVAATVQGDADCPLVAGNMIAFLAFHFDVFKSFSTATLNSSFAGMLLIVLALVSMSLLFSEKTIPAFSNPQINKRRQESLKLRFRNNLIHWLALHENSPSVI